LNLCDRIHADRFSCGDDFRIFWSRVPCVVPSSVYEQVKEIPVACCNSYFGSFHRKVYSKIVKISYKMILAYFGGLRILAERFSHYQTIFPEYKKGAGKPDADFA
jgi:hypothetical protein